MSRFYTIIFLRRRFIRIPVFPHEKNFVEFIILRIAADNAYKHTISSIITTKLTIYRIKNRQLPPLGIHRRMHIFIECNLYIRMS